QSDASIAAERALILQTQLNELSTASTSQAQDLEKRAKDIAEELRLTQEANRTLQQAQIDFEKVVKSLNTQVSEGKVNEIQLKQQLDLAQGKREEAEDVVKQKNLELEQIKTQRGQQEAVLKTEIQKLEKVNKVLTSG